MLYKIHNHEVTIDIPKHYVPSTTPAMQTRKRHSEHYTVISTRTDTYKHSFYPSTIPIWNQLPSTVVTSPSTESFSKKIQEVTYSGQSELYMGSVVPAAASSI